jgi:hypothetical protein
MDLETIKSIKFHYIIGMGHSGTTLMSAILNASEEILAVPEIHASMYFFQPKSGSRRFNDSDVEDLISYYRNFYFAQKMKFYPERIANNIDKIDNYALFLKNTYLSLEYPGKPYNNIRYIVEKNPTYTFYVAELLKIFPGAKFILMIRDPRGYINSCLQKNEKPGVKKYPPAFYMYVWRRYFKEMMYLLKHYPEKCSLVRYEDLASKPEITLREICRHFEIPFSPRMLEHHKSEFIMTAKAENLDRNSYVKMKVDALSREINPMKTEAWKKNISGELLLLINRILYRQAAEVGYQLTPVPPAQQRCYFLCLRYRFMIWLYFVFAKRFYLLPIRLRELIRKQV